MVGVTDVRAGVHETRGGWECTGGGYADHRNITVVEVQPHIGHRGIGMDPSEHLRTCGDDDAIPIVVGGAR